MSSTTFSSDLKPDPQLRRIVAGTGVAATIGGALIIAGLPLEAEIRGVAGGLWLLFNGCQLGRVLLAYRDCSRIRVDQAGTVLVYSPDGCCLAATLAPGSVVLRKYAWLRFRTENGRNHVELMRQKTAQSKEWRRLQVIWRHLGAGR